MIRHSQRHQHVFVKLACDRGVQQQTNCSKLYHDVLSRLQTLSSTDLVSKAEKGTFVIFLTIPTIW